MARRRLKTAVKTAFLKKDLAGWNFVIFLTLAFILLVITVAATKNVALDLRSRAGLGCPNPLAAFGGRLPKAGECDGEWKLSEDARGCQVFVCQTK